MKAAGLAPFHAAYCIGSVPTLLGRRGTLALFDFGQGAVAGTDPRHLGVLQEPLATPPVRECWSVAAAVTCGRTDELRWACGGGWRFVAVELAEDAYGGIEAATTHAYDRLFEHVAASPERNLLRIWNYLGAINAGEGDAERYRRFCSGRARSMAAHGVLCYPAATAIGHHGPRAHLQVYALCSLGVGSALENPRQVSAWEYPRQYGPTAPSFARAMRLPGDGLAISGTAAVIGHASRHGGDAAAQAGEAVANLEALLACAGMPPFDAASPLKVYVRHPAALDAVRAVLDRCLDPVVPRLFLQGDVCRSELLVEIDGWRFAGAG